MAHLQGLEQVENLDRVREWPEGSNDCGGAIVGTLTLELKEFRPLFPIKSQLLPLGLYGVSNIPSPPQLLIILQL